MTALDSSLLSGLYKVLDPLCDDSTMPVAESSTVLEDTITGKVEDQGIFQKFYFKMEQSEWSRVNKELRQHGLPCVELADPRETNKSSDAVIFTPEMAKRLRDALHTLMRDCDRRQELLQELIATNNQLRQELRAQTEVSVQCEGRARKLSTQLDETLGKDSVVVEDGTNIGELRNSNAVMAQRIQHLRDQNEQQETQIEALTRKLQKYVQQEAQQDDKDSIFEELSKNGQSKTHDERIVDIIDSYERRLSNMKAELDRYRPADTSLRAVDDTELQTCKATIKSYERQLREAKNKSKGYENDLEIIKLELQSRPDVKDLREYQAKTKKLEAILRKQQHKDGWVEDGSRYSTHVEELEGLPVAHCRRILKHVCLEARVDDVEDVAPRLRELTQLNEAQPKLKQFASDVLLIVSEPDLPHPPDCVPSHPHRPSSSLSPRGCNVSSSSSTHSARGDHAVWCEKRWYHVLPTLRHWATQLRGLKELQSALNHLQSSVLPWRRGALTGDMSITALTRAVHSMVDEDNNNSQISMDPSRPTISAVPSSTSRSVLQGIVDHFMNLFDVSKLTGCYTRMNDIYTKLGEVHNVMNTLRNLLDMPSTAKSSDVVDAVARVCEVGNNTMVKELANILDGQDITSVLEKLEQHEDFFPMFQSIINKLMDILNVTRIDQIIPGVRALKIQANS